MRVLCVIQARLGSTRLPRKSLMDLCGRPVIEHVVERVRRIRGVTDVVLAVPRGEVPALLYAAHVVGPNVPEADVLGRFAAVIGPSPAQTIMRVTGDCPLLDPVVAERVLSLYLSTPHCEYAWNVAPGYVDGEDVEVFSRLALLRAHREATDPADREHVTSWIRRHYPVTTLPPANDRAGQKTSIDTLADLDRVRAIMTQGAAA